MKLMKLKSYQEGKYDVSYYNLNSLEHLVQIEIEGLGRGFARIKFKEVPAFLIKFSDEEEAYFYNTFISSNTEQVLVLDLEIV